MKDTKFVKCGGHDVNSQMFKPWELMDPDDSLPKSVFARDSSKFPGGRFAIDGWLRILQKVGLQNNFRTINVHRMCKKCRNVTI